MTPEELERLRAKEVRDKVALKRMLIGLPIVVAAVALFVAADTIGLTWHETDASVIGIKESWSIKHGHRCIFELATGLGTARIFIRHTCDHAPWHLGDSAHVQAQVLRITRTVVIRTKGTIFRGAESLMPIG